MIFRRVFGLIWLICGSLIWFASINTDGGSYVHYPGYPASAAWWRRTMVALCSVFMFSSTLVAVSTAVIHNRKATEAERGGAMFMLGLLGYLASCVYVIIVLPNLLT